METQPTPEPVKPTSFQFTISADEMASIGAILQRALTASSDLLKMVNFLNALIASTKGGEKSDKPST